MNIIRSILTSIAGTINRYYSADGRPDERLKGKMYQHYGFRSSPPAGVELVHIEQGNTGFSVAENDGNIPLGLSQQLAPGEVAIYNTESTVIISTTGIIIDSPKGVFISTAGSNNIRIVTESGKVIIGPLIGIQQALANKAFVTAVGAAFTTLGVPGFDPATIATGIYNTSATEAS